MCPYYFRSCHPHPLMVKTHPKTHPLTAHSLIAAFLMVHVLKTHPLITHSLNSSLSDGTCTENTSTDSTFSNSSLSSASTENDNTDEEDSLSVEFVAEINNLKLPSSKWVIQNGATHIGICKLTSQMSSFAVSICITVNNNFSWNVSVNGVKTHPQNCGVLKRYPTIIDVHTLQLLIANVDKCIVCPGNPDRNFVEIAEAKKGELKTKNGVNIAARLDKTQTVFVDGIAYSNTIRHTNCEMLRKCTYRPTLRVMYHRWTKQKKKSPTRNTTSNKTNIRTPEKVKRYSNLRSKFRAQLKELTRLTEKIQDSFEKNNVCVDSTMNNDFIHLMHEMTETVHSENPEGSFKRIFWVIS